MIENIGFIGTVAAFEPMRGRNCVTVSKNSMFSVKNLQKAETVTKNSMFSGKNVQNAETVPKKPKKPILTDSQGPRHPRAQDLVKIVFFGFFGTVSAF